MAIGDTDRQVAESVLRASGWLSSQPAAFQDLVLSVCHIRSFPSGATIYLIGDPADAVWGLVEGSLSVLVAPEAASPTLVHVARPGWWVGDTALITGTPRRATLTARADSVMVRLSRQAIDRLAESDPQVWRRIAQITVGHLDHALSLLASLKAPDAHARVALTVRLLASNGRTSTSKAVVLAVSQEEIGEIARLNRNVVASILRDLDMDGLIERGYRRIRIRDLAALDRYAAARLE